MRWSRYMFVQNSIELWFMSYRGHREKKLRRKQCSPSLPRGQWKTRVELLCLDCLGYRETCKWCLFAGADERPLITGRPDTASTECCCRVWQPVVTTVNRPTCSLVDWLQLHTVMAGLPPPLSALSTNASFAHHDDHTRPHRGSTLPQLTLCVVWVAAIVLWVVGRTSRANLLPKLWTVAPPPGVCFAVSFIARGGA